MATRKRIEKLEESHGGVNGIMPVMGFDMAKITAKLNELVEAVNDLQQNPEWMPSLVNLLESVVTGVKVENPNASTIMCAAFGRFRDESEPANPTDQ